MKTYIRLLFVVASLSFSLGAVAADNGSSGGTSKDYADCMNGCWKSHDYCKEHQSGDMDCNHQLGQCIEYCESTYDPQIRRPGGGIVLPPRPPIKVYTP
jgi:hypothetical protein